MLDRSQRLLELMAALGSIVIEDRVRALHEVQTQGVSAVPTLVEILDRPDATMPTLAWTMMGIAHFGPTVAEQAHSALVRSSAIRATQDETDPRGRRWVPIVRLLAVPEQYEGREVLFWAFVSRRFENDAAYMSEDDFRYSNADNAIWLSFDSQSDRDDDLHRAMVHG